MTMNSKMTLSEAVNIMNENIPEPNNKMVDYKHLPITIAWEVIKEYLCEEKENECH